VQGWPGVNGTKRLVVSWWNRRGKRWTWVVAGAALVGAIPAAVASLPVPAPRIATRVLLEKVRSSDTQPYAGLVESTARLGLPDVHRAERLTTLLGETTTMRAWKRSSNEWRVDELTPIGERGTYQDHSGLWTWDSARRATTRIEGVPSVRFLRAADLLPPALGRAIAVAAEAAEVTELPPRRVAEVPSSGIRITPQSPDTTIGRVDMWVHPATGLPTRVEVTARSGSEPLIVTSFLDFQPGDPQRETVRFEPPADASFNFAAAPDFAQAVDRYSPFVLPERIAGLSRRTEIATGAGTYGDGFTRMAVLALSERFMPFEDEELAKIPTVVGPWGVGHIIETPLFNVIAFEDDDVVYIAGGTVRTPLLQRAATELAAAEPAVRE
jgi:hypothetical protein